MEYTKTLKGLVLKAVVDNDPIPPTQKPRGYGGVATLHRKSMNLKVRKCSDGGSRIVVTEIVSDPQLCIINVYLPCRNSKATDAFEDILLELQEVLDKYTCTHAIILLGDMNSSLLNRGVNVQDKKLQNFCAQNDLVSLQHGVPTFFHVNGDDEAEIDYILLNKKAKPLVKTVRVDNYTVSNTSDHVPVYIILNIKAVSKNLKPVSVKMKPRWENCNKLAYKEYIAKYIPTFHLPTSNFELIMSLGRFILVLKDAVFASIPNHRNTKNIKNWTKRVSNHKIS